MPGAQRPQPLPHECVLVAVDEEAHVGVAAPDGRLNMEPEVQHGAEATPGRAGAQGREARPRVLQGDLLNPVGVHDAVGLGEVPLVQVEGGDVVADGALGQACQGTHHSQQHRPLEGVDAGPAPDDVVGAGGHVEMEPPVVAHAEAEPVVARDVLEPQRGVPGRVVQGDDGAAGLHVLPEQLDHVPQLIHPVRAPRAQARPVASGPGGAVVREVLGAGEVVREPLHVVAARQHPHGLGDLGRQRHLALRHGHVAEPRLLDGDRDGAELLHPSVAGAPGLLLEKEVEELRQGVVHAHRAEGQGVRSQHDWFLSLSGPGGPSTQSRSARPRWGWTVSPGSASAAG